MAKSKSDSPPKTKRPDKSERIASLAPHILILAEQSLEQLAQLSTTLEASISLDTAVAPQSAEDVVGTFAPPEQIDAMRRSLKAEMRRQAKTLGDSINAIYACAAELHRVRHYWPAKAPRSH
ncbi:MAG: hypothetical protein ACT6UH_13045 [Hydrogenophaga sp.]|uniref:hypothetical protein n=1 Tax=Hydrogenophaga sp. TaxID=1904254 RepID=UPI004036C4B6